MIFKNPQQVERTPNDFDLPQSFIAIPENKLVLKWNFQVQEKWRIFMSDIVIKQFNKFLYFFHFYFNLREAVNLKSLTFSINHAPFFRVLKGVWRVLSIYPKRPQFKSEHHYTFRSNPNCKSLNALALIGVWRFPPNSKYRFANWNAKCFFPFH